MDFGAFILGILFGWLLEWLYVTFFSSKGSDMGDCTAFERELKTRNEEIKSLKSQLSGSRQGGASLLSKGSKQSTASVSAASSKPKSKVKAATKSTKVSASKNTAGAGKKVVATTKGSAKSTKSKASPKKNATTATSTKKAVSPKTASKTVKKVAAKDPAAKNTATKKKPAAKKISLKKDIKLNNPTGDDLTKLSGIGPSMAATLSELGITSYKKLAAMDDDILRDMLEASGARLNNNKEAMDSWNEQAMLADKGDFKGLKALQDSLKS